MNKLFFLFIGCMLIRYQATAQSELTGLGFTGDSLSITQILAGGHTETLPAALPLVSFVANSRQYVAGGNNSNSGILVQWMKLDRQAQGLKGVILFRNITSDTVKLENIVPFGISTDHVYITGKGDHELSRTHLFLPGKQPVNVIVPDNAWDMGYCSFSFAKDMNLVSLVRRNRASIEKGSRTRFETILYPGGSVKYDFYAETATGNWQDALTHIFQGRMLYDVTNFDNSLFERKDLQWIRHSYVMHLMMTWDKFFYDTKTGKFNLLDFVERGKKLYGGDDIISIWPTWPTLGLDQRNQFDLFRDLPGGTRQIHHLSDELHHRKVKLFVCYNPWDESTRNENHFSGISDLIAETAADGVVLDTKGESSKELQHAADKVRNGVIMYSEGMAVPKDMSGIPSGRVHNALYYPPMLNLNKLIKPEFAIYRVAELYKERIQREFATSFFNGYGTELNIMAPGQPDWVEEQYAFLGKTTRILRENTYNFTGKDWIPLISTTAENIWVNKWPLKDKTIYTIYSVNPEGYNGYLFEVEPASNYHFVDIWHHRLLTPKKESDKWLIEATTNPFNKVFLGTNNEGEVDCIAKLPELIKAGRNGDLLTVNTERQGDEVRIWPGVPAYSKKPLLLKPGKNEVMLNEHFGRFEGDFIIQLLNDGILLDETVLSVKPGEARRTSLVKKTPTALNPPSGMVKIPAGNFTFKATHGDEFIPYPQQDIDSSFNMPGFYMDQYPVTNSMYKKFLDATGYKPSDTANYLKHWKKNRIKSGEENFPVVYISYEDAKAYAKWAGKRLPTEIEWQYAAQTPGANEWPWKQELPVKRKIEYVTNTLSTSALEGIDSSLCNLGDGKLYPVGKYKKGVNPYGLYDLTGCVWQLTNDEYMSGSFRYIIMKGGSYFKPSSSWWYVQGGPRELHYRQHLLRMSQGFERNATVGFRCVKDAQ
ncbi:formylglycine-generating enzyme family protein [Flavihumibacter profundi]|uniref:formylglycine-generating enzyme family protein n=1 Tax=Flavihumibacter profundi TaxID=2716883 RepID=UPI001CC4B3B1|nr:SUMF1/EgtB/PvdO family nonheme iron enzyme [Flavihumibacter profundi]MBZ5855742.1 formylglycine-generating enzyme family protein [Flavihumibacter profundi]